MSEPSPDIAEARKHVDLFFAVLKSLDDFGRMEVKGVINNLIAPSPRDECFVGLYYRVRSNVSSLLTLRSVDHFQALAMLARSIFELAADVRLIDLIPNSVVKIDIYGRLEKLRAAEQLIKHEDERGLSSSVSSKPRRDFAQAERQGIKAAVAAVWTPEELKRGLKHWSALRLPDRVKMLDAQFQEVYAAFYSGLSWNVHAGLTGVVNLKPETFLSMCVQALDLSRRFYQDVLEAIIKEFRLAHHDPKILDKLKYARLLPLTKTQADIDRLRNDLGL
jgi:hypothetical protein